jgi:uncharacterized protein with PIN domain
MKLSRAQKKAKLEAAAELIESLLEWDEENEAPNLSEIEEEVLLLRQRFGQALAATVLEGQEAQQLAENPVCPECDEVMRTKGKKRKGVESRVGSLEVERGYYYCPRCKRGFFPPRQATRVVSQRME